MSRHSSLAHRPPAARAAILFLSSAASMTGATSNTCGPSQSLSVPFRLCVSTTGDESRSQRARIAHRLVLSVADLGVRPRVHEQQRDVRCVEHSRHVEKRHALQRRSSPPLVKQTTSRSQARPLTGNRVRGEEKRASAVARVWRAWLSMKRGSQPAANSSFTAAVSRLFTASRSPTLVFG